MLLFVRDDRGDSTPFNGLRNFLLIVGSIGGFVSGIVIMVKQGSVAG